MSIKDQLVYFALWFQSVKSVTIQLQSSWSYYMPKVINLFGNELALFEIQCDFSLAYKR